MKTIVLFINGATYRLTLHEPAVNNFLAWVDAMLETSRWHWPWKKWKSGYFHSVDKEKKFHIRHGRLDGYYIEPMVPPADAKPTEFQEKAIELLEKLVEPPPGDEWRKE